MLLLFALIAGSTSLWADDYSYDFSSGGTNNSTANPVTNTWETNYFTILQEKGTSNTNVGNYLTAPRWYQNHTITITPAANVTITQIVINCSAANYNGQDITASTGSISKSSNNSTWTGSITSSAPLVLTMGKQCRPGSLDVTYSVAGNTPTCATPKFLPAAGVFIGSQNVSISCDTQGATIYYTTDGTDPTASSSVYSAPIAVSSTTTIKVLAKANGYNDATTSAAYTFPTTTYNTIDALVEAAPTEPVILNLTDAQVLGVGSKDMYVKDASGGLDFYLLGLSYTAGQKLNGKVAVTGYSVYNGMPEITGIGENQIVASAGNLENPTVLANGAAATLENYKWKLVTLTGTATGTKEIDGLAIYTNLISFDNLIANVDNVTATGLIIPYKKGENPVVPELLPTNLTYHITLSKDLVTYYAGCKLDFNGTGLTVYKAKVENGVANLTTIDNPIVAKEKGIILSGTAGQTYNVPVATANATSISDNELVGVKAETAIAYKTGESPNFKYNYILQNGVFKKATGDKLKAGKAYLTTTFDVTASGTGAPGLEIVFGDATGINTLNVERGTLNGEVYNLAGQRVAQPTKGLYIVNGKKVVIK